jgi:hypothetical protein
MEKNDGTATTNALITKLEYLSEISLKDGAVYTDVSGCSFGAT